MTTAQNRAAASRKRTDSSVTTVTPAAYASLAKMAMAPKPTAEAMQSATPRRCGDSDMDNIYVWGREVLLGRFGLTSCGGRRSGANPHRNEKPAQRWRRTPRGQRTGRS